MSLAVGIIAKDGIVLASDSRASSQAGFNDTVPKIFQLADNYAAGVSGDGALAAHIFDLIKHKKGIDYSKGIHEVAEQLRDFLSNLFDKYYPNDSPEKREPLEILLAGYSIDTPSTPHLYLLQSSDNFIPRQSSAGHNSIGAAYISDYILNRVYEKGIITAKQAAKLSVFCIKESSEQFKSIGGRVKVGTLFGDKKKFEIMKDNEIGKLYKQCTGMQDAHKNKFYPEESEGYEKAKPATHL